MKLMAKKSAEELETQSHSSKCNLGIKAMKLGFGIIDSQGENDGMVTLDDFIPSRLNTHPNK